MDTEPMAYIGRAKCGCIRAVSMDDGDRATARAVADMIKEGLTVERVATPVTFSFRCPHKAAPAKQEVMPL